jgi:hypothetical protein
MYGFDQATMPSDDLLCRRCHSFNLDTDACPDSNGYCLDCCSCPEHYSPALRALTSDQATKSDDALEALREKFSTERRQPEATVETYALGHYEQMVLSKALAYAIDPNPWKGLSSSEQQYLTKLQHIFASHGTVTVTRTNQED